ncbi:MAG: hypothetical protein K1X57_19275, partial [Gemmataceae bacterium]|nr:hypothetical protein [Gemmataceae bacterium]
MDPCFTIFGTLFVLFLVACFPVGAFVIIRQFIRGIRESRNPGYAAPDPGKRVRCPRCGTMFGGGLPSCPQCNLDPHGEIARELRDLEASARTVDRLKRQGMLETPTAEAFQVALEARQHALIVERPAAAVAAAAEPPPALRPVVAVEAPAPVIAAPPMILPPPLPRPAPVQVPRRSLGDVFSEFMKERNILWGELIGGLLIVGCSIALVISLWRTLEDQIHYFPFL